MLDEILSFEENIDILDYTFLYNNTLIWPFVRFKVFEEAINNKLNIQESHDFSTDSKLSNLKYMLNAVRKNPFRNKQCDILMFYSDISNILNNNKKYYSKVIGYFAEVYKEKTAMIETHYKKSHHQPKQLKNVKYEDIIFILTKISAFKDKVDERDIIIINKFIKYLQEFFPVKFDRKFYIDLKNELLDLAKKIKYYDFYYKKLFKNIKPKIVFIHCGCYGNLQSLAIKVANEIGIQTAEFQHGLVSLNHPAYNYGRAIFNSEEYQQYMPKHYLTYGQYWNDNIRMPIKKVSIGNPHFTYKLQNYNSKLQMSNKCAKILIVSQGTITKELVKLTEELSRKLKDSKYQIIYRLHPGEVGFKERYESLYEYSNVLVNTSGDIYDLIYESDYIVGVYSTTLIESIAFDKHIFVYEHVLSKENINKNLGIWFSSSDELYNLIINKKDIKPQYDINYYWSTNWKDNYKEFLENLLNKK